jgi:DNA-binding MarR family transcriptional regulator
MSTLETGPAGTGPAGTGPAETGTPQSGSADPVAEAQIRVGDAFKAATGALRRLKGRETHRPGELSYAQYGLLFGLAAEPELPASRLALAADLSPASTTQMLDHLEDHGLVKRVRSELDKRVVLVSLTERGLEVVAGRRARFEGRWREALEGFDETELLATAAVLDRLREMFDGYAGKE